MIIDRRGFAAGTAATALTGLRPAMAEKVGLKINPSHIVAIVDHQHG
jgi:hypothetical protein